MRIIFNQLKIKSSKFRVEGRKAFDQLRIKSSKFRVKEEKPQAFL